MIVMSVIAKASMASVIQPMPLRLSMSSASLTAQVTRGTGEGKGAETPAFPGRICRQIRGADPGGYSVRGAMSGSVSPASASAGAIWFSMARRVTGPRKCRTTVPLSSMKKVSGMATMPQLIPLPARSSRPMAS
jgi:hypothetical protein